MSFTTTPIANVWSESKIYHHFSSINSFGISQTFPWKNLTAEAPYLGPVITTLVARLLFPLSTKIHFLKIWKPWTLNCQSCVVLLLPLLILDSLCAEFEISCIMINSRKWAQFWQKFSPAASSFYGKKLFLNFDKSKGVCSITLMSHYQCKMQTPFSYLFFYLKSIIQQQKAEKWQSTKRLCANKTMLLIYWHTLNIVVCCLWPQHT